MSRGGHARSEIRGRFARLAALLLAGIVVTLLVAGPASASSGAGPSGSSRTLAPVARASSAPGSATVSTAASARAAGSDDSDAAWTLDQAEAAVSASTVARLPGAPAVYDEASVRAAIGAAPIHIALLPFAPVDDTRAAMEQQAYTLNTWGTQQGWPMIVVQGLQVTVSSYDITPGAIADLEPVLAHNDVTHQILRAITVLQQQAAGAATTAATTAAGPTNPASSGADSTEPSALPAETAADPAQVQTIGDALAAGRIYNDPGLRQAQTIDSRWANVGTGLTVRAAFLPSVAPGGQLTDLIGPLAKRFPGDVVVVMRGRWIEVAGPDQEMLDSAVLWLYGNYMKPFLRWEVQPSQAVGLLAGQIGLLRTGVVSNQQSSAPATTSSGSADGWLAWLLAGAALLLAGIGGWWAGRVRRNSRAAAEAQVAAGILTRRRFGARLAGVAGRIVDLDGFAPDGEARNEVAAAVERYRMARDVLTSGGDLGVAGDALDSAERHLAGASRALGGSADQPAAGGRRSPVDGAR